MVVRPTAPRATAVMLVPVPVPLMFVGFVSVGAVPEAVANWRVSTPGLGSASTGGTFRTLKVKSTTHLSF